MPTSPALSSSPTYTNAASLAFLAQLKKYDPSYTGGIPDLGAADGWPVANLMVEGLQLAGKNPTQKSFIANLSKVSDWTDSGLATGPVRFDAFGKNPPTQCFSLRAVRQGEVRGVPVEREVVLRDDPPRARSAVGRRLRRQRPERSVGLALRVEVVLGQDPSRR